VKNIHEGRVAHPELREYAEKYAEWFVIERSGGIIELRVHAHGGTANFFGGGPWRDVWSQIWYDVGNDPENKVAIITGTGEYWVNDTRSQPNLAAITPAERAFETQSRVMRHLEGLIFGLNIPTIGILNGPAVPGFHTEIALFCDITLCATDVMLRDPHVEIGIAPGDGLGLAFQMLLGPKRAAYYLYTGDPVHATTMREIGLVNEVLERDALLPRARDLARWIADIPDVARLMTTQIVRRPVRQRFVADAGFHLVHEQVGALVGNEQKPLKIAVDRDRALLGDSEH
jgi:enoyl-CoA hydratase/carnithine racemase